MTDFVCAILPFFILWDLKISRKAKTSVWILLCFGMLSITDSVPQLGSSIPLTTWGVAEIHSGIIAGSIPALRPLFLCIVTRLRGDSKLPGSSYESRSPYRYKKRNPHEDDDGNSVYPLHDISDAGNQGGIVKTTEFEVTNTTNPEAEVRPENSGEGGGLFASPTPEGSSVFVNSAHGKV
ncbi:hypothetical protein MMC22_005141 [Lobaria immixta]|nr:hypothetical protein [Lobaria immixta]